MAKNKITNEYLIEKKKLDITKIEYPHCGKGKLDFVICDRKNKNFKGGRDA